MPNKPAHTKSDTSHPPPNVASLLLAASGTIILAWTSWVTWHDMTSWGKDITLILFEPRTGEAISLGIGMKVIHYLITGIALLLSNLLTLLQRRTKWLHHFGHFIGKLAHASAKLAAGLTLITILGISLYLSPLRGNTVAVVGAFASLSAVIIALLAAVEIEIISAEEENVDTYKTSPGETHTHKIIDYPVEPTDFSYTGQFEDINSSEAEITLSSHYAPTRAHLLDLSPKKRHTQQ